MSWTSELEMFADLRKVARERSVWRRIAREVRPLRSRILVQLLLVALGVAAGLGQPFLFRAALDTVIDGDAGSRLTMIAIAVLAVGLLGVGTAFCEQRGRAALNEDLAAHLRDRLFTRLQRVRYSFFIYANPGAVGQRVWEETTRASTATMYVLGEGTRAALTVAAAPVLVAFYDVRLAGVLLFLGLFVLPSSWVRRRLRTAITEQVMVQSRYAGLVFERVSVAGALLTRVFGLQEANRERLRDDAKRHRDLGVTAGSWQAFNQLVIGVGLTLGFFLVIWIGGHQVANGSMTIGELALLLFYLRILATPIQNYSQIRFELIRGFVAFTHLFEVLDLEVERRPAPGTGAAPVEPGVLELDAVSFAYPRASDVVPPALAMTDAPPERAAADGGRVLDEVSFRVERGAFVALAGSSGSGKSTVAALAAGLYPVSSGRVLLGGVDIQTLEDETLRRAVGLVTQDTHLIHDSIRNNLLLVRPDATDKELVRACVAAGIHKFIRGLPNGYGTIVGERGVRLSGGQRQRLAFARVLLLDPAVVILDEPTAHLDAESESLLREAVDNVMSDRTRLVIAHRLSTIVGADQILVLEDGRVVEQGTHDTLICAGGRYEHLYRNQLIDNPSELVNDMGGTT